MYIIKWFVNVSYGTQDKLLNKSIAKCTAVNNG